MTTDTSAEALEQLANSRDLWPSGDPFDRILRDTLLTLAAEKRRAREGVTDELVDEFWGAYGQAQGFTARKCPAHLKKYLKKALEAVWPDAKDAERFRWWRDNPEHPNFSYLDDARWYIPYQSSPGPGFCAGVGVKAFDTLEEAIDAAMQESDHD